MELLIQNQFVRLNIVGYRESQNLKENKKKQEKPTLMENIGNLRLKILVEFRNMKILFLTEVKSFKNEFLESSVQHSLIEKVHTRIQIMKYRRGF